MPLLKEADVVDEYLASIQEVKAGNFGAGFPDFLLDPVDAVPVTLMIARHIDHRRPRKALASPLNRSVSGVDIACQNYRIWLADRQVWLHAIYEVPPGRV